MSSEFEMDPECHAELDWVDEFVRDEVEPLDDLITHARDMRDSRRQKLVPPLQRKVRARGLGATHLGPGLGGPGFGQGKLAVLNEIVGATEVHKVTLARQVFGGYEPTAGLSPTGHLPRLRADAERRYAEAP